MLDFEVRGLADEAQATSVVNALAELIRDEGLEDEVGVGWSVADGQHWISGETDHPVGISRFHAWRPHFEASLHQRIHTLAPAATTSINWQYPAND